MTDSRIGGSLLQRAAVTLAAVGVYRLLQQIITVPGFDASVWAEFFGGYPAPVGLPEGGGVRVTGPWLPTAVSGTMAIGTYIVASGLVLLFSGFVPFLRRLREGEGTEGTRFNHLIVAVTAVLAALYALSTAYFLESVRGQGSGLLAVPAPGWTFRLGTVLTLTAAALLVVWLAHLITARGIGNGVAMLLVTDILIKWWVAVPAQWRVWMGVVDPLHQGIRAVAFFLALSVLTVVLVIARRSVPLERAEGTVGSAAGSPPALPLRVNPGGFLPIFAAQAWLMSITGAGCDASLAAGIAFAVLIVLHSYVCVAITFHPRDALERVERYGFRLAAAMSSGADAHSLRVTLHRAMVPGVLGLCLVGFAPWIAESGLGMSKGLSRRFGPELLVLAAVGLQLFAQAKHRRALAGKDWVVALTAETHFELDLAADVLRGAGITSAPHANRVISATGTLALWEASRPRWPSLTVYRNLGGGETSLLVASADAETARRVLHERGLAAKRSDVPAPGL